MAVASVQMIVQSLESIYHGNINPKVDLVTIAIMVSGKNYLENYLLFFLINLNEKIAKKFKKIFLINSNENCSCQPSPSSSACTLSARGLTYFLIYK
jgi:hypothetical protein